jgi:hypothetical protein
MAFGLFLGAALQFVLYFWLLRYRLFYIDSLYFQPLPRRSAFVLYF